MKYFLLLLVCCFGNGKENDNQRNQENVKLVKLVYDNMDKSNYDTSAKAAALIEFFSHIFKYTKSIRSNLKNSKMTEEVAGDFEKVKELLAEMLGKLEGTRFDEDSVLYVEIMSNLNKIACLFHKEVYLKTSSFHGAQYTYLNFEDISIQEEKLENFWEQDLEIDKLESNIIEFIAELFDEQTKFISEFKDKMVEKN